MNRYCGGRFDLGLVALAGPHCARPAGRKGGPTGRSVTEAVLLYFILVFIFFIVVLRLIEVYHSEFHLV